MAFWQDTNRVNQFRRQGYLFPIRALERGVAASAVGALEGVEQANPSMTRNERDHKLFRFKPHLIFTWLDRIAHSPEILDTVEELIGPDILIWSSALFIKESRDPAFLGWHQDSYTYSLDGEDLITAWVALTDATVESGAMRFVPGSHLEGLQPHVDTWDKYHLGSRGETVDRAVDERMAVDVVLEAGEMSLHHIHLLHASKPNTSPERRIGYAVRYLPPRMRQRKGRGTAMLARGEDRFGHWDLEPRPQADQDAPAMEAYRRAMVRRSQITFEGTVSDRAVGAP